MLASSMLELNLLNSSSNLKVPRGNKQKSYLHLALLAKTHYELKQKHWTEDFIFLKA